MAPRQQLPIPTWRTYQILFFGKKAIYLKLKQYYIVTTAAQAAIETVSFSQEEEITELTFARVTPEDLGITSEASLHFFYNEAGKYGLKYCNPEHAIYLRVLYREQPKGETISVAMQPKPNREYGAESIFVLKNKDGSLILDAGLGSDERSLHMNEKFIFLK